MSAQRLIIDTDPGIDDAMAIFYAAAHPGLDLVGLTTVFGNVPVATATRNALRLAEMTGLRLPVAEGAGKPLVQPLPPHPDFVHGVEGFGDVAPETPVGKPDPRPAARFLCDLTAAHPGEVTICAIGPLTNLAEALRLDPAIQHNVDRVVVMGGAVECPGNVNEHAEANIWNDPHAAAAVFGADWPVTLMGLDVTERVNCSAADFAALAAASPVIGGFLNRAVQFYFRFHAERHGLEGCHMHDPTALVEITDPGLFKVREAPVTVTLEGEAAELLTLQAAARADAGTLTDIDVAMAKLYATEALGRLTDRAVQTFGGMGLVQEYLVERWWRDARVERIWDGTSEIQRHIISRGLLRPLEARAR